MKVYTPVIQNVNNLHYQLKGMVKLHNTHTGNIMKTSSLQGEVTYERGRVKEGS
jgi:hypothetical protein